MLFLIFRIYSDGTSPPITQYFNHNQRNKNANLNLSILKYVNGHCLHIMVFN